MTADNDVVLPSFTNVGEPTCVVPEGTRSSSADVSIIYSSIPPDVNTESMSRATKSRVGGEMLRVSKRPDGKLSIFACDSDNTSSSVYKRGHHSVCVVCHRNIADREMFLNFPDDLDRRRLWGNILGFKYSDMLRLRDGSVVLSTGHICTDHFSEECFRVFNFNKAAIEALGMPSVVSPGVRLTPSRKWIPWDCTVCSFQSHSVSVMQRHMVQHTDDVLLRYHRKSPKGLLCPFCRKCTYGYKTMSGLRRHLMTPPIQHCQLKRIYEVSRANCRSSLLEPIMKWSSWTDRNVYLAYHGCEPPPRTPRKQLSDDVSTGSESPNRLNESPEVLQNSPSSSDVGTSVERPSRAEKDEMSGVEITPRGSPIKAVVSDKVTPSLPTKQRTMFKTSNRSARRSLFFPSSPVKNNVSGTVKASKAYSRPILQLRKPVLPLMKTNATSSPIKEQREKKAEKELTSDEKCRTVAKVILKATSAPPHTLVDALNLMSSDEDGSCLPEDPAITKPLFATNDVVSDLSTDIFPPVLELRQNKTRRQLESLEARLRIFGDCYGVEIPTGYSAISTRSGVRLVEGKAGLQQIVSDRICLPRGRFVPISHP